MSLLDKYLSNEAPDVEVLEKIVLEQEKNTIKETVTKHGKDIIKFLVHYAWHAIPEKDKATAGLEEAAEEQFYWVHADDGEDQPNKEVNPDEVHNHDSLFEWLTPSDIAYVLWQVVNSHEDWTAKIEAMRDGDAVEKYKCGTKWTSDRKLPAMEDRADDDEGKAFYNKCVAWARDFKSERIREFVIALNKKSIECGIYKKADMNLIKRTDPARHDEADETAVEVPLFDLDGIDLPYEGRGAGAGDRGVVESYPI